MIRRLLIGALLVATLSTVLASAAQLGIGDVVLQASAHNVSVGPIGHCADLPAETVCIEVPPPSAPTGLGCDLDLHDFAATLSWDPVPAADTYDIYHGVLWVGPEHLDTVAAGQTNYGLRPALLHHRYHLTATHIGGESVPSATISVHCAPSWLFYSGPHALGATTLLETEALAPEAAPVETETSEDEGGDEAMRLDGDRIALARSLAPASPADGEEQEEPTSEPTAEPTPEATPEIEVVELPPTRIVDLSWAQDGRSLFYVVLRSTTPGGSYAQVGVVEGGSFVDEVATAATYYYVVVGVDEQGAESHPSEEIVSPGIVLPPVVKAPKPLATMPECANDVEEETDGSAGGDGELLCALPTATPAVTATPTPAASPKPGDGECADISIEGPCEPSAGPPPEGGVGAGGSSEPSPTPLPTATPTEPSPTATPTAAPTPEATSTPVPTPRATPEPTPTPEPTSALPAEPTSAPEATSTPDPTPVPTAEPAPTAGTTPEPTVEPVATPESSPEPPLEAQTELSEGTGEELPPAE